MTGKQTDMKPLIHDPANWISWKVAWVLFVATILSYTVYYNLSEPLKLLAGDQQILDMRGAGYTPADASVLLNSIGEEGRALYRLTTLLDTLWPLLLAITSVFFSALTFRTKSLIVLAPLFPVAFGALDTLENMGILVILSSYPDISAFWVSYCESLTRVKWLVIPLAFPVFFALPLIAVSRLLFVRLWQARQKRD